MNLYYQCTQNDINNYALHHFGGETRSYPRWVKEYNVCIDHIHRAKTLHLDFFHDNGTVEKRPCDPQSHDSTTYIGQDVHVEVVVVVEPVIVEPKIEVVEVVEVQSQPEHSAWVHCAKEGQHCDCNNGGKVAYGAPNWMNDHFDKLVMKDSAASGIVGMLEVIESDFARLEAETSASEASAQKEYDTFMTDSKVDKAAKVKDIEHKTAKKQDQNQALTVKRADLDGTQKELDAALAYFDKLKPSCVDAGVSYEDRVGRRKEEIESLQEALKILNGEDIA